MDKAYVSVQNLRGKYIKQLLTRIEELNNVELTPELRKCILDEINDLFRELYKTLGYEV